MNEIERNEMTSLLTFLYYGPLTVLTSLAIDAHSVLCLASPSFHFYNILFSNLFPHPPATSILAFLPLVKIVFITFFHRRPIQ